jgi:hypothetical protein
MQRTWSGLWIVAVGIFVVSCGDDGEDRFRGNLRRIRF